ncbi:hypothetical protein BX616_006664, partial [Lobosporangium transversale]
LCGLITHRDQIVSSYSQFCKMPAAEMICLGGSMPTLDEVISVHTLVTPYRLIEIDVLETCELISPQKDSVHGFFSPLSGKLPSAHLSSATFPM